MKNITISEKAYQKSKDLLRHISSDAGFVASAIDIDNYRRVFARDGVVATLASLMSQDKELIETGKKTLKTLAKYQDETGRIISNVSPDGKKISFGTQVGRIDASAWFVIGVGQYVKRTKDKDFAKRLYPSVKKTMQYLAAIETNGRGFLYIPYGGDWADEYLNHGYVLFDQLLYLQAQRDFIFLSSFLKKDIKKTAKEKCEFLQRQILVNFIPKLKLVDDPAFYQRSEAFEKLHQSFKKPYAFAYFVQGDIGEYFDAFANVLLLLLIDLPENFKNTLLKHFYKVLRKQKIPILPAFSPVIKKDHDEKNHHRWKILQFSYMFRKKNRPYHFHNGGLWPLIQGFFISALCKNKKKQKAVCLTIELAKILDKEDYKFSEYFDGKYGKPNGTEFLGFSAASYMIAYLCSHKNKKLFL